MKMETRVSHTQKKRVWVMEYYGKKANNEGREEKIVSCQIHTIY